MKVYLIPFAGGTSYFYNKWKDIDLKFVPLEYSGHGTRMEEPLCHSITDNARDLFCAIDSTFEKEDYAIFGHSLGGLVAYELYKYIADQNFPKPKHMFISGCRAPHLKVQKKISQLEEVEYKKEVLAMGGVSEEYFQDKRIYQTFNPILKNDFWINDIYIDKIKMRFECGVSILNGLQDNTVNIQERFDWYEYCQSECNYLMYEGGHFYLNELYQNIIKDISSTFKKYNHNYYYK